MNKEDYLFMAGRLGKVLVLTLITLFSLTINGCFYGPNSYQDAAFHDPGSIWKSSDPDIWFTVNEDGENLGEFNYNGKKLKIGIGSNGNVVAILLIEADSESELQEIIDGKGGTLISTSIQSCSKTKLVLKVFRSNLPDLSVKQIVFTRSQ